MELGILLSGSGLGIASWEQGFELAAEMGYTQVELAGNDVSGAGAAPDLGRCNAAEARRIADLARSLGRLLPPFSGIGGDAARRNLGGIAWRRGDSRTTRLRPGT